MQQDYPTVPPRGNMLVTVAVGDCPHSLAVAQQAFDLNFPLQIPDEHVHPLPSSRKVSRPLAKRDAVHRLLLSYSIRSLRDAAHVVSRRVVVQGDQSIVSSSSHHLIGVIPLDAMHKGWRGNGPPRLLCGRVPYRHKLACR
eukprot:1187177-Prorocentrum_minimum.AAC.4